MPPYTLRYMYDNHRGPVVWLAAMMAGVVVMVGLGVLSVLTHNVSYLDRALGAGMADTLKAMIIAGAAIIMGLFAWRIYDDARTEIQHRDYKVALEEAVVADRAERIAYYSARPSR